MNSFFINFAYFLESSTKYYNTKHFFYETLEDNNSKKRKYFDFFMIFLVLSTVGILIFEVNHTILPWLDTYETIAVFIFIVEWIGRLWVNSHAHKHIINDYEKSQLLNHPYKFSHSFKIIIKEKLRFIHGLVHPTGCYENQFCFSKWRILESIVEWAYSTLLH